MMHRICALLVAIVLLSAGCAAAKPEPEGPPVGKHVPRPGEPPAGAFEACNGKSAGITCAIGYRTGTCQWPSTGEPRLACMTEGAPGSAPSR